jgi:uncharacterized repeat protein (TIGR01451 family)
MSNIATASYELGGQNASVDSNVASLSVAERLDVTLAAVTPRSAIVPDAAVTGVPFLVTNTGNGEEAFDIAADTDQPAARVQGYAIDRDGNGVYDAAVDTLLNGTTLPALGAGARQQVFVLVAGAAAVGNVVTVRASVRATTGSGAAATTFAGRGDGGGDAVVGKTGAAASAQALLSPAPAAPTLAKTQSVSAPDGSARAMHGAIITYTLTAHFNGATRAATVADPIPAGTVYRAGSLHLDDSAVSDAADADAGNCDGSTVRVALGDVAAAGDHVITFQTTIQ